MSMISSQCDKLRERATVLRQGRWSDGEDDATLLIQAADTIWELRCKLADMMDQRDEIERLKAENAKLRELVLDLYDAIDSVFWDGEVETRERFEPRMSELGIEEEPHGND